MIQGGAPTNFTAMNQMSMAGNMPGNMSGFPGHPGLGNMPMPNNMPNGAVGRMGDDHIEEANYEAKLNSLIYGYFFSRGQYDVARSLKESGASFDPPIVHGDNDLNGADNMQTDTKDGINDLKPPGDLPDVKGLMNDGQGGPFLLSWFTLFLDVYFAQRKDPRATANASLYVDHTQQQARLRQGQQHQMMQRIPMGPHGAGMGDYGAMMRFPNGMQNDNLQRRALQNRGGLQPTPQQMAQMQQQRMLVQSQHAMRRENSQVDMNGQRPRTPSGSEHAQSPSKRIRMDNVPFNGQQMIPNGRAPPPGMAGQMMGGQVASQANDLLMQNGINPGNLSESQFASFQQQNPAVQQKSIQVYAQNLAKNQRQQSMSHAGGNMSDQGSPIIGPGMDVNALGPSYYGGDNPNAMQMRGAPQPNVPNGGAGGNHALQDYQMQLMLLEQQNKKRLLMARQEQDTINPRPDGMPGLQGAYPPGMSPSGSRGGPSPGPGDQKRGSPKMNQVGLPGSPMPDGSMRGSPAAMNFNNGMHPPDMYSQMNGNGMRPPSSNPGFANGQYNPQQQMEQIARVQQQAAQGGRVPNGWQQGPQGQAPMIQQPPPQQPAPMGTPQQRNDMPPPQGVPNATANGRVPSPAPPTPQQASKANPKKPQKEPRDRKKPPKKNPTATSVAPTPTSEAENGAPTPTPATPVTPQHAASFATKNDGQGQQNLMQGMTATAPEPLNQQQPDPNGIQFSGLEGDNESYNLNFNDQLTNPDLLENFDFEQFLQSTNDEGFNFDPSAFEATDGIEAGMGGGT